jgi:hypothetical protein
VYTSQMDCLSNYSRALSLATCTPSPCASCLWGSQTPLLPGANPYRRAQPIYLDTFNELCDTNQDLRRLHPWLPISGLTLDARYENVIKLDARYENVIKQMECAQVPMRLLDAVSLITAHAVHHKDDSIFLMTKAEHTTTPSSPRKRRQASLPKPPEGQALPPLALLLLGQVRLLRWSQLCRRRDRAKHQPS